VPGELIRLSRVRSGNEAGGRTFTHLSKAPSGFGDKDHRWSVPPAPERLLAPVYAPERASSQVNGFPMSREEERSSPTQLSLSGWVSSRVCLTLPPTLTAGLKPVPRRARTRSMVP